MIAKAGSIDAFVARSSSGAARRIPRSSGSILGDDPRALAPGVWHSVRIVARSASVTVDINGTVIGTHQIGDVTGAIVFSVTAGAAQFRNFTISDISEGDTPRGSVGLAPMALLPRDSRWAANRDPGRG
jgi:hypothetical protein